MRGLVPLVALAAVLGACASSSAGTAQQTSLTVRYWPNGPGAGDRETWTLRCNPPGGTLARPAVACQRLVARGAKVLAPVPAGAICTQIYGGPQIARVVGTLRGKRIAVSFARTNGCEISRWNQLSPWLLPRGSVR